MGNTGRMNACVNAALHECVCVCVCVCHCVHVCVRKSEMGVEGRKDLKGQKEERSLPILCTSATFKVLTTVTHTICH